MEERLQSDDAYFEPRADEELKAAEIAADAAASEAHRDLAEKYRALASAQGSRPTLRLRVGPASGSGE